MRSLRIIHHSIPLDERIPMKIRRASCRDWGKSYALCCTFVPWADTYRLHVAVCYKCPGTSSLIPFDSSRRADSYSALPVPGGCLADELYTFSYPLTSISMRSLRIIPHSIPLDERIPM